MASRGKTKEYQIQAEIESQDDWDEQISKEGLLVVDVYQDWCGPCKAMVPIFKRIKNETGDDLLRFAVAKADLVESLERYKGRSEPNFLFYAGGVLVEAIRGANAPGINQAILDQLAIEHNILETGAARIEITDKLFPGLISRMEMAEGGSESGESEVDEDDDLSTDEDEEEARRILIDKEYTVLYVMPIINNEKNKQTIANKLKSAGYDILQELEYELSTDESPQIARSIMNPEILDEVINHLSMGATSIMVISKGELGKNVIQELKEFIGPDNYFLAKEIAPTSLRAILGDNDIPLCGLICSENIDDTRRSMQLFFPTFLTQKISVTNLRPSKEYSTVGLIMPLLYSALPTNFYSSLQQHGFKILFKREVEVTSEQATKMFKDYSNDIYYNELMQTIQNDKSMALLLSNNHPTIIIDFLEALGSNLDGSNMGSLRGKFMAPTSQVTQLHGSLNENAADREKRWFFPMEQVLLLIKPIAFNHKDYIMEVVREEGFLVVARKMYILSPEQIRVLYGIYKSPKIIEPLIADLTKSPSCFLILTRNSAIDRLKDLLGYMTNISDIPADLDREEGPEGSQITKDSSGSTLASHFGVDAELMEQMRNIYVHTGINMPVVSYLPDQFKRLHAIFGHVVPDKSIHISENAEQAARDIEQIFGDVKFDRDGYMKKKKNLRLRICDEKVVEIMTKEEVYEEIAKMPPPLREEKKADTAAEEKLKKFNEEKQLALLKERQKEEAKQIYEAKFIDPADLYKWGAMVEYPPPDKPCTVEGPFIFDADVPMSIFQPDLVSVRDEVAALAEYEAMLNLEEEEEEESDDRDTPDKNKAHIALAKSKSQKSKTLRIAKKTDKSQVAKSEKSRPKTMTRVSTKSAKTPPGKMNTSINTADNLKQSTKTGNTSKKTGNISVKSADKPSDKTSAKTTDKASAKTTDKASTKTTDKTSTKTTDKTSTKTTDKTSTKTTDKTSTKTTDKTSTKTTDKISTKTTDKTSTKTNDKISGKGTSIKTL